MSRRSGGGFIDSSRRDGGGGWWGRGGDRGNWYGNVIPYLYYPQQAYYYPMVTPNIIYAPYYDSLYTPTYVTFDPYLYQHPVDIYLNRATYIL